MQRLVLEKGADYDFLIKFDPRYALRLSNLFCRRFGNLEELVETARKWGLEDGKFYIFRLDSNAIPQKELSVYYFIAKSLVEAVKIRIID
jgi:hypothetical protein